jgi:simple sugar transport system ATP-binding protein
VTLAAPIVEADGVSKRFGATLALDAVSLTVGESESRALVGRNGAGKSTLVSILTGLTRADAGGVRFGGEPAPAPGDRSGWQERVACVYQHSTLLPQLTVAENLFLNNQPRGRFGLIKWKEVREGAVELLEKWGIGVSPDVEAGYLDVEERQQVEIARALASGSRFLILDEPTARLEGSGIRRLFSHLTDLRERGVSLLYISHHLDEIYEVCDTVTVLRDGRLVHDAQVMDLPKDALIEAMVGRPRDAVLEPHRARPQSNGDGRGPGTNTLRVESLRLDRQFSDISFDVHAGELVGLAGLAGSGKTAVAETIAGLRKPHGGHVKVGDDVVPPGDVRVAIEHGIGFVPQDRRKEGFAPNLSIEENVTLTVMDRLGRFGFVSPRRREEVARELMDSLEVVASGPEQLVAELSGGNQQKVVVARALTSKPRAMVVVSPTAGVDVASKEALFETLTSFTDVPVLVVSDELDELAHCDRVLVMFDGRLTHTFDAWDEHELVAAMEGVQR